MGPFERGRGRARYESDFRFFWPSAEREANLRQLHLRCGQPTLIGHLGLLFNFAEAGGCIRVIAISDSHSPMGPQPRRYPSIPAGSRLSPPVCWKRENDGGGGAGVTTSVSTLIAPNISSNGGEAPDKGY